jgi:hypothetical protein
MAVATTLHAIPPPEGAHITVVTQQTAMVAAVTLLSFRTAHRTHLSQRADT